MKNNPYSQYSTPQPLCPFFPFSLLSPLSLNPFAPLPLFLPTPMNLTPTSIEKSGPGVNLTRSGDLISVAMADPDDGLAYTGNQLTLTFDLANYENVVLAFEAKESGDEPHPPRDRQGRTPENGEMVFGPVADFNFDGVAISADGETWYEARGLRDLSSRRFLPLEIDLDQALAQAGLFYSEDFKVRVCQYDNMPRRMDGITIHAIRLTGAPLQIDPSLVLHLPMDDNAPNPIVRDKTRKHHQAFLDPGGNPHTDAHTTPGAVGTGLAFDGVDDQISLDTQIVDLGGPFTIGFWFDTNNSKWQYLFGRWEGAGAPGLTIVVYSDGRMMASLTDDNGDNVYTLAHGAYDFTGYAHLSVVRTETLLSLYVNGVLRSQTDRALATITPDSMRIGTYAGVFAECSIDDFRAYDRALDLSEVETLCQMGQA